MPTSSIATPCIKVCTMDAQGRVCLGCGRSLDEIARWASMSEAERRSVMADLPDRLAAAAAKLDPAER